METSDSSHELITDLNNPTHLSHPTIEAT